MELASIAAMHCLPAAAVYIPLLRFQPRNYILRFLLALMPEIRGYKVVQSTVHDGLHIAGLHAAARVLHQPAATATKRAGEGKGALNYN